MAQFLSLDEVTTRCIKFLRDNKEAKPNIAPEYHRLHEGICVLRLWLNGKEDEATVLQYPLNVATDSKGVKPMESFLATDRLDVIAQLDGAIFDRLVVYERSELQMVMVVDVANRFVLQIPSVIMVKSNCIRNLLGTINPTPPIVYGPFFDSLKDKVGKIDA